MTVDTLQKTDVSNFVIIFIHGKVFSTNQYVTKASAASTFNILCFSASCAIQYFVLYDVVAMCQTQD